MWLRTALLATFVGVFSEFHCNTGLESLSFFLQKPLAGASFFSLYDCSLLGHWQSLLSSFYLPYHVCVCVCVSVCVCVCVCVCIHIRINFWLCCFDPSILDPACLPTSCQLWDGVVKGRRAEWKAWLVFQADLGFASQISILPVNLTGTLLHQNKGFGTN